MNALRKSAIGTFVMITGIHAGLHAEDTPTFVPGTPEISEENILRRMEEEIGLKHSSSPQAKEKKAAPEQKAQQGRFRLKTTRSDGASTLGYATLSQESIHLRQKDAVDTSTLQIPLKKIRRIEIRSWKTARIIQTAPKTFRVFHMPDQCVITDTSDRSFSGSLDALNWLQILIEDGNVLSQFRSYYAQDIKAENIEEAKKLAETQTDKPADLLTGLLFVPDAPAPENADAQKSLSQNE